MLHIALYQPEIPPNTGNIIRLCANVGATLHLIHPLGFSLEDKQLKRAGLDYHEYATLKEHANFDIFCKTINTHRLWACTTKATQRYCDVQFQDEDVFLFGPETTGLPTEIIQRFQPAHTLRLPMKPGCRSLNLSNAVAVIVYEAWRQLGFF